MGAGSLGAAREPTETCRGQQQRFSRSSTESCGVSAKLQQQVWAYLHNLGCFFFGTRLFWGRCLASVPKAGRPKGQGLKRGVTRGENSCILNRVVRGHSSSPGTKTRKGWQAFRPYKARPVRFNSGLSPGSGRGRSAAAALSSFAAALLPVPEACQGERQPAGQNGPAAGEKKGRAGTRCRVLMGRGSSQDSKSRALRDLTDAVFGKTVLRGKKSRPRAAAF